MVKPRAQQKYHQDILPLLQKEWDTKNALSIPRITKIVINVGITDEQHRDAAIENMREQLSQVTGQRPIVTKAKLSIASFKVRAGDSVGVKVTLRNKRMYEFMDKLVMIALPRVKDFQGIKLSGFDGQGNYNLGIAEQIIFPEVEYDKIDKVRSLEITLVTTAKSDAQAKRLLELFGFPFEKPQGER